MITDTCGVSDVGSTNLAGSTDSIRMKGATGGLAARCRRARSQKPSWANNCKVQVHQTTSTALRSSAPERGQRRRSRFATIKVRHSAVSSHAWGWRYHARIDWLIGGPPWDDGGPD